MLIACELRVFLFVLNPDKDMIFCRIDVIMCDMIILCLNLNNLNAVLCFPFLYIYTEYTKIS
jgi:hypothetical protein